MALEYDKYLHLMQDLDASEEEKLACLEALWEIAQTFADLAHGVHATQLISLDSLAETLAYFEEFSKLPLPDDLERFVQSLLKD